MILPSFISKVIAKRRLQRMTEARAASFELELYRKNRAAQIARRTMRRTAQQSPSASVNTVTKELIP